MSDVITFVLTIAIARRSLPSAQALPDVSRAQRSGADACLRWCAAEPGPQRRRCLLRSRISGAPLRKGCALHRVRDTRPADLRIR
jgi:hypothetical protein